MQARFSIPLLAVMFAVASCCCPTPRRTCCPPVPLVQELFAAPAAPADTPAPAILAEGDPDLTSKEESDPATDALRAKLSKKRVKGLHWDNTPLEVALVYLRTITGWDFALSPAARDSFGETTITLQLDDVPLDTVLDLLTKALGLRWEARDGGVWIDKQ